MGLKGINRFNSGKANNKNKPDVVVMDKREEKCLIIDIALPFDTRISEEKLEKYQDLKEELKRIWNKEALGALGIVSTSLRKCMITCAERGQGTRAATDVMPLGNS